MPRADRDPSPGTFHLTVKALGPGAYYLDPVDRLVWRATLARTLVRMRGAWTCIAYCQVTTHVHLIVAIEDASLSLGMQLLNGEYARAFNRTRGRKGPLLTRRFHAVRITTEGQLASTFRYDMRNPVAAGICASPLDWPHSSYAAAIGAEDDGGLTDATGVLDFFGHARDAAIAELRGFVELPTARAA